MPPAIPTLFEEIMAQELLFLVKTHVYLKLLALLIVACEIYLALGIKRFNWATGEKWQRERFAKALERAPV